MNRVVFVGRISNIGRLLWAGKNHRRKIALTEDIDGMPVTHQIMAQGDLTEKSLFVGDIVLVVAKFDSTKALITEHIDVIFTDKI